MPTQPTSDDDEPLSRRDIMNSQQVSDLTGIPKTTIEEFARCGRCPARKLGRRWVFVRPEINQWIRRGTNPGPDGAA